MKKPYVLTDDLSLVFQKNIEEDPNVGKAVAKASNIISSSLGNIFSDVIVIPGERIYGYLKGSTENNSGLSISLTSLIPANGNSIMSIESSRSVGIKVKEDTSFQFTDIGSQPRCNKMPAISDQFQSCVERVKNQNATAVTIIDDVVFTGGTVLQYVEQLRSEGINVNRVVASVALKQAIEKLNSVSVPLEADFIYEDVVDEVCMRDFVVGAPGGGRNLLLDNGITVAVPYIYPFSNVEKWASISPNQAQEFSRDCLIASKLIWDSISPDIRFIDLEKRVFQCDNDQPISETCSKILKGKGYERFANTLRL